ncbi:hypothetical protein GGS21DRAFT_492618 [Xylaria nigripes]|nr:hypothetical protein GGS21DRAFT_492618 [Xylaria nigripes]
MARWSCQRWKRGQTQAFTLADFASECPTLRSVLTFKTIPEMQLIFSRTSLAFFTFAAPENDNNDETCYFAIVGCHGDAVDKMGTLASEDEGGSRGQHEFVILGRRRNQFLNPTPLVLEIERRDVIAYRVNVGRLSKGRGRRRLIRGNLFHLPNRSGEGFPYNHSRKPSATAFSSFE